MVRASANTVERHSRRSWMSDARPAAPRWIVSSTFVAGPGRAGAALYFLAGENSRAPIYSAPASYRRWRIRDATTDSTPGAHGAKPRNLGGSGLFLAFSARLFWRFVAAVEVSSIGRSRASWRPIRRTKPFSSRDLLNTTGAWPFQENHCGYVSSGYLVNGALCVANAAPLTTLTSPSPFARSAAP